MSEITIVKCDDYSEENVIKAFDELNEAFENFEWVTSGMKIAIKANLVTLLKPETAATTHPVLLCELVKRLTSKGAIVTIGDSPGGPYNSIYVNNVYAITKVDEVKKYGGLLNQNFEQREVKFKEGKVLKDFPYTSYLDEADVVINFCKLKSHGMMGMSAATKNLFGIIPGTKKPEFHFRFPNHSDFANMLIDLNEFLKPKFCIVDAVIGMEGNGPTAGTPRKIGAILVSKNPYKLDLASAAIMGLKKENIPTLEEAYKRELIPESYEKLDIDGDITKFFISDYENILTHKRITFEDKSKFLCKILKKILSTKPRSF